MDHRGASIGKIDRQGPHNDRSLTLELVSLDELHQVVDGLEPALLLSHRRARRRPETPLRIAILGTRGIPARYGGFETFAEKLAIGLTKRGFDVTVFCEENGAGHPPEFQGVHLRYHRAPSLGSLQTILFDLRCLWSARKGFDVVYMLGYGCAPFCILPRFWSTSVWLNPDGLEWARAKWGRFARLYFKLMESVSVRVPSLLIPDSHAIASSLTERHGKLVPFEVIAYGCDIVEAAPPPDRLSAFQLSPSSYFLVVCRFEPENHVLEILRGFEQSKSERELILVGDFRSPSPYVRQLLAVQNPRIRFVGTVYDGATLKALRYHAFAYVHGHSVGGTNPSLLEAMGCANLTLAHDNAFNRETLGSHALFFSSVDELTKQINGSETLSEEERMNFRAAIQARARTEYSWDGIIATYAALLTKTRVGIGQAGHGS